MQNKRLYLVFFRVFCKIPVDKPWCAIYRYEPVHESDRSAWSPLSAFSRSGALFIGQSPGSQSCRAAATPSSPGARQAVVARSNALGCGSCDSRGQYGEAMRGGIAMFSGCSRSGFSGGGLAFLVGFFILCTGLVAPCARGQAVYGSIGGTVVDDSGGAIANASVTIKDVNRNIIYNVSTDASGAFKQAHLIIGTYRVQVEAQGFKQTVVENVEVAVDTVRTVEITMQPGSVSTTVTVTDEAPLLKTERTDVATTLSDRQVDELPTFGRNFSELMLLTPGTVQFCWGDTSTENPQGGIAVNVNGQMFVGVGSVLDGTDNRDFLYGNMLIVPNLDSVDQVKVTSANYDAEFGQVSAAVITTSTKSGTNDWHGGAFWYRRSD